MCPNPYYKIKDTSSFHFYHFYHVKKKPCLNDRDENPKPLDKDRDTMPMGLEEQSSRPGQ
jgi:hypothetical protein